MGMKSFRLKTNRWEILIVILILAGIAKCATSTMSGYQHYGYMVVVSDPVVFEKEIDPNDHRILEHGRYKLGEIMHKDHEIDGGDGKSKGLVRWYQCDGIDCDEGWERTAY